MEHLTVVLQIEITEKSWYKSASLMGHRMMWRNCLTSFHQGVPEMFRCADVMDRDRWMKQIRDD